MTLPYPVQAMVIPRSRYPAAAGESGPMLGVCLVFSPKLKGSEAVSVPECFRDWPRWIENALRDAELEFITVRGKKHHFPFHRKFARDLYHCGWNTAKASGLWHSLFDAAYSRSANKDDTPAEPRKLLDLYLSEVPPSVNPTAASDLNPHHRLESPQTMAAASAMMAAHFDRLRDRVPNLRAELNERLITALPDHVVDDTLLALARRVDEFPERYTASVRSDLHQLVGQVSSDGLRPATALARMSTARRQILVDEVATQFIGTQQAAGEAEIRRVERNFNAGPVLKQVTEEDIKRDRQDPSFHTLLSRVRQYPGLARRLSLVVHGTVTVPRQDLEAIQGHGSVRLSLNEIEETSRTRYHLDEHHFRPAVRNSESFTPEEADSASFYRHHLFSPRLYTVTQQDYMRQTARLAARSAGPADAGIAMEDPKQVAAEELSRHNANALHILSRPRLKEGAISDPAEVLNERLKDSVQDNKAHRVATGDGTLYAEDLIVGVTVFVRPRNCPDARWRSLCRRIVRITPKGHDRPVVVFEEEGTIVSATAITPAPVIGQFVNLSQDKLWIKLLSVDNTIKATADDYKLRTSSPVQYHGCFSTYITAEDLKGSTEHPDDIVRLSFGEIQGDGTDQGRVTAIEVVPVFQMQSSVLFGTDRLAAADSPARPGDRFAVLLTDRTRYLDEKGNVIAPDPKEPIEPKSTFFVEGEQRLMVGGPAYPNHQLFATVPVEAIEIEPLPKVVYVHAKLPPWVLREHHLRGQKVNCRTIRIPTSTTDIASPVGELTNDDLLTVREVLDPLTHVRGTVVRIEFDTIIVFQLVTGTPAKAFINIHGQSWEVVTSGPGTFPPLLPDQGQTTAVKVEPGLPDAAVSGAVLFGAEENSHVRFAQSALIGSVAAGEQVLHNVFVVPGLYRMDAPQGGVLLDVPSRLTESLIDPNYPPKFLWLRISGEAKYQDREANRWIITLRAEAVRKVADVAPLAGDPPFQFSWLLHLQTGTGPAEVIRYPAPLMKLDEKPIHYDPALFKFQELIHPAKSVRRWVDLVTGIGEDGLSAGLAWPQAIPGTATLVNPERNIWRLATLDGFYSNHLILNDGIGASSGSGYFWVIPSDPSLFLPGAAAAGSAAAVTTHESALHELQLTQVPLPPLVGELIGKTRDGDTEVLKLSTGTNRTVAISLDADLKNRRFRPTKSASVRKLGDLRLGEMAAVWGTVDFGTPDRFVPGRVRPRHAAGENSLVEVSAVVRGRPTVQPLTAAQEALDGLKLHSVMIRSPSGAELLVYTTEKPGDPNLEVTAIASPLIVASTVSKWVKPAPGDVKPPVHATISDLIARWSGTALTVSQPGNTDAKPTSKPSDGPFAIICDRRCNDVSPIPWAGPWPMIPLRFDREYEFCLRRVDLAGNHLYDEAPPSDRLPAEAIGLISSVLTADPVLIALAGGAAYAAELVVPRLFVRADRPFSAPLAVPAHRSVPAWERGTGSSATPYSLTVFEREQVLVLISDVCHNAVLADGEASASILPPSVPVETVLMHGVLDRCGEAMAAGLIQRHEEYLIHKFLGMAADGCLNYFGDPQVERYQAVFVAKETDPPPANAVDAGPVFAPWPKPRPIEVAVARETRSAEFATQADLARQSFVERTNFGVRVHLPPGTDGFTALLPVLHGKPTDIGQRLRVVHATNGPWLAPVWTDLHVLPPKPGQSSRQLQGTFEADVATTSGFTISGYWNECDDESLSAGWEEATLDYKFACIPGKVKQDDRGVWYGWKLNSVAITEKGYGYGTDAVPLWETPAGQCEPEEYPVLEPVVDRGRLSRLDLLSSGLFWVRAEPGNDSHIPLSRILRIIRRPPLHRTAEAVVTRSAGGPLTTEQIEIQDEGGWYTRTPFVVASDLKGKGTGAKLTARLNGHGGVSQVIVEEGGDCWSDDVVIRFYTHHKSLAERAIPRDSTIQVSLDPRLDSRVVDSTSEPVWHPFSDGASRCVDYYLTATGRFNQFLAKNQAAVSRTSAPRTVHTTASTRPQPPKVAHLLPAFHWSALDQRGAPVADSTQYFVHNPTGTLTLNRRSAVRVYLRRPWHKSGPELLGVVLGPTIANTTRIRGDLNEHDGFAVNRAADYPNASGRIGSLTADVIPPELRGLVSRWGFDPVWAEGPLPPLANHHFPAALGAAAYETITSSDGRTELLASLALHDVQYDGAKNLWYSDVAIRFDDLDLPGSVYPFVQLNLVAYQPHALAGITASEITSCDPFPLVPDRTLKACRGNGQELELTLSGVFAATKRGVLPNREVSVSIRPRLDAGNLPPEVEYFIRPTDAPSARPRPLEVPLTWDHTAHNYRGRVRLPGEPSVITILERELYRTVSDQPSPSGDRAEMHHNIPTASRTLTTFSLWV